MPADPELLMVISENGGCLMMGPNCRTFGLWSDGTAAVYRGGTGLPVDTLDQDSAADVAIIGAELATRLATISNTTDFDALVERLEPGSCQACVDGIDYWLTLHTEAGARQLSSNEFAFDQAEPLFQAVGEVLTAMSERLQLPLETHP